MTRPGILTATLQHLILTKDRLQVFHCAVGEIAVLVLVQEVNANSRCFFGRVQLKLRLVRFLYVLSSE